MHWRTSLSNFFGNHFRIVTFGESHGRAVGVVIDRVKPGLSLTAEDIQRELDRRKPGQSSVSTARREEDRVEILSGVFEGRTLGTPICMVVWNSGQRSGDYDALKTLFRPGHADFTYEAKYGIRDHRGGGRASARETVGRVAAGALAKKELAALGVTVVGGTVQVGSVKTCFRDWGQVEKNPVRCPDADTAEKMERVILEAKKAGDSVGGVVEIAVEGVPAGLGDPVFGKLDALLAGALMSVGAVKGVEIGEGFRAAELLGSENNDGMDGEGFRSNRCGGILGGISTGAPIVVRVGVKPTPSIALPQSTVDREGREQSISIRGRHDPCICPRIVPVVEAMCALVIYDAWLAQEELRGNGSALGNLRRRVDRIDEEILELLREREEAVRCIGAVKAETRTEVLDTAREQAMKVRREELVSELGLDGGYVEKLFEEIIGHSRSVQR